MIERMVIHIIFPIFLSIARSSLILKSENYPAQMKHTKYLYINYTQSEHTIEISGTTIIPEFPSFLVLPLFMIATLLAVIVYRRKRCQTDWAE